MKNKFLLFVVANVLLISTTIAQPALNLTPKPYEITSAPSGTLALPQTILVSVYDLPDSIQDEVRNFATIFSQESHKTVQVTSEEGNSFFSLRQRQDCGAEEYYLDITSTGIFIEAKTTAGFFYAFQTIRKILNADGSLPIVGLHDFPRFEYRGFMLDVSRHFFSTTEVKRLIDLMARYKLNRFHWHLTDDQGWRVEIEKYPKLTTIAATAPNCYATDMKYGPYYTNRQYGPFFYTKEEIRDVIAYAKERHVEIIPEIDMPGHFVAALCAYPEFSCTPNANRSVWINGGISGDVLNVGNPAAVQFCKDILGELADLFPYEQIHIGGDECPTGAWEGNAQCQSRYRELGLNNYRQLQSHFIKEMSDFLALRGKKTSVWNEAISAGGADTNLMQEADVTVYCWTGPDAAAKKAANLGLNNIYTPWGPYYINRKQSTRPDEPSGAGDGTDNLRKTYTTVPVPSDISSTLQKYYTGVQGTFWCEHVADTAYLEYLALPRLFAIAEAGWTQQKDKNYDNFVQRVTADTALLNRLKFNYCKHDLNIESDPGTQVMPTAGQYYRIVTRATDDTRKGRCIELLSASSPLCSTYADKGAAANVLWTNTQANETAKNYDSQFWTLEESPTESGKFALVCKAAPNGSVNPSPTVQNNTGRWRYDASKKNYNFVLGEAAYGQDGANYYYTIRSDKTTGWYMNASMPGQGLAANLWTDPLSGNGGLWTFIGTESTIVPIEPEARLEKGKYYQIFNTVAGYEGTMLADTEEDAYLRWTQTPSDATTWQAFYVDNKTDGTQGVRLKNLKTGRFINSNNTQGEGKIGWPVRLSGLGGIITIVYQPETRDYTFALNNRNFFPLAMESIILPGVVSSGSVIENSPQGIRPQGTGWQFVEIQADAIQLPNMEQAESLGQIFDLQGRRIAQIQRGVNIVYGKKIIK